MSPADAPEAKGQSVQGQPDIQNAYKARKATILAIENSIKQAHPTYPKCDLCRDETEYKGAFVLLTHLKMKHPLQARAFEKTLAELTE